MMKAIELFRIKADECELLAKRTIDKSEQAELMDMCARLHWMSGEVARLQSRITQIEGSGTPMLDPPASSMSRVLHAKSSDPQQMS